MPIEEEIERGVLEAPASFESHTVSGEQGEDSVLLPV